MMAESQAFRNEGGQGRSENQQKNGCLKNSQFLSSAEGILKLIEFVTVLIAWAVCIADRKPKQDDPQVKEDFNTYFLVVGILCWIFTIFVIFWNVAGYYKKYLEGILMKTYGWFLFLLAYSLCWVFFWFSGALILIWNKQSTAGAVLGILNTILFLIDSVMYYRVCRKYRVQVRKLSRGIENVRL